MFSHRPWRTLLYLRGSRCHGLMRFRARDTMLTMAVVAVLLVAFEGVQIVKAGEVKPGGIERSVLFAGATQIPAVTSDAFDAATLGASPSPRSSLRSLLVTGDSMSMPLGRDLAQRLDPRGVHVITDPHIGTGISETFIVDWRRLATTQVRRNHPQAVVVFIGANDGFPMAGPGGRQINCCGPRWAAIYANRVRRMAATYRQNGTAHVYWITLPAPRERARQAIARVVNAAISVGVRPWAAQVRTIDTVPIFTPGFVYRDAMSIRGNQTLVRQADGIHLNDAGASLLAGTLLRTLSGDFSFSRTA